MTKLSYNVKTTQGLLADKEGKVITLSSYPMAQAYAKMVKGKVVEKSQVIDWYNVK